MLVGLATLVALAGFGGPGIPNPHIIIHTPQAGDQWRVGDFQSITWTGVEVAGPYRVEVQYHPRLRWEVLTPSVDALEYSWKVFGPNTRQARIRITALDWPTISETSDEFTIYHRGPWSNRPPR